MTGARPAGRRVVLGGTPGMAMPAEPGRPCPGRQPPSLVALCTESPSAASGPEFPAGPPTDPPRAPHGAAVRHLSAPPGDDPARQRQQRRRAAHGRRVPGTVRPGPPARSGERNLTPPGRGGAPQQPIPAPGPEATRPLEERGGRAEPPCPKAEPRPTAAKSRPPQPPEVLAATSKAKPAQAKAPKGPGKGTSPGPDARPPQDESSSEYYSTSESQCSEAAPQEDDHRGAPQRKPREEQWDPRETGPQRAPGGPAAPPQDGDRRRPAEPAPDPRASSRTHHRPGHHGERPKAKLVQHISPEREPPGRRRMDPPLPARGRRSRSAERGGRARVERSRSPRAYRSRRTHREDSRSPSDRRRRSRSRSCRHEREARSPGDRRQRNKEYAQSLQKGRGRAGRGHAQGKGRPGQASFQDRNQERGPQHARPASRPQGGRDGPGHGREPAGRSGKGKGPPRAPGKGRRGQGTGSQRTRSLERKRPNTPKQERNNDRRKERAGNRLATKAAELLQEKRPDDAKKNPGVAAQWFD